MCVRVPNKAGVAQEGSSKEHRQSLLQAAPLPGCQPSARPGPFPGDLSRELCPPVCSYGGLTFVAAHPELQQYRGVTLPQGTACSDSSLQTGCDCCGDGDEKLEGQIPVLPSPHRWVPDT